MSYKLPNLGKPAQISFFCFMKKEQLRTLLLRLWLRVQQYTMNIFHRLITRLNKNKTYIFNLRNNNMFCTPKTCGLKLGDLRFSRGTVLYNKFRPASNLLCFWHFRCLSRMINDGKFIGAFQSTVFSVENLFQTRASRS